MGSLTTSIGTHERLVHNFLYPPPLALQPLVDFREPPTLSAGDQDWPGEVTGGVEPVYRPRGDCQIPSQVGSWSKAGRRHPYPGPPVGAQGMKYGKHPLPASVGEGSVDNAEGKREGNKPGRLQYVTSEKRRSGGLQTPTSRVS